MRWLFVGEALVLRKEQRILVFFVLKPYWHRLIRFAEARSICLGRSEPRFLLRLRGNHTGSASTNVKRSVGILGGETAKQHLPSAELRDGPDLAY